MRQGVRRRNHVWLPNRCLRNTRPSDHSKLTALNPPLPQVQCWRVFRGSRSAAKKTPTLRGVLPKLTPPTLNLGEREAHGVTSPLL